MVFRWVWEISFGIKVCKKIKILLIHANYFFFCSFKKIFKTTEAFFKKIIWIDLKKLLIFKLSRLNLLEQVWATFYKQWPA